MVKPQAPDVNLLIFLVMKKNVYSIIMIKGYYKVGVYLLLQDLNPTRWEPKAKN